MALREYYIDKEDNYQLEIDYVVYEAMSEIEKHNWNGSDWLELAHDIVNCTYQDFLSNKERQPWTPVNTNRLAKILRDYGKTGIIRDENGLIQIAEQLIRLCVTLWVNTALCGHDTVNPSVFLKEYVGEEVDEVKLDDFTEGYCYDDNVGQYRISDYAIAKLYPICVKMTECKNAPDLLSQISMLLNVVHQRSDLSAWLIEGGIRRLNQLNEM